MTRRSRITAELVALIAVGSVAAVRFEASGGPQRRLRSAMVWSGCHGGSCAPSFYPVPDGELVSLRCDASAHCYLFPYVYWSDENCNRLTACPQYRPHRGDVTPAR